MAALRDVANVETIDPRATFVTEMQIGDRVQDVWLVGVRDFADQHVNVVEVRAGRAPRPGSDLEAMTDPVKDRGRRQAGDIGDTVMVRSAHGRLERLSITGAGGSVYFSHQASEWIPVLYVPIEVVWELASYPELFTQIELRVTDRGDLAAADTVDTIREHLAAAKPTVRYNDLVEIRPVDQWPGQDDFDKYLVLFWVIAGVSLVSAAVLVASTMTTLVREQSREIGIMKSLGGTRRRIIATYLTTSLLLSTAGTVAGIAIGVPMANFLTN